MKLGFVTAILDSWTYEEMMDFASEQGFESEDAGYLRQDGKTPWSFTPA